MKPQPLFAPSPSSQPEGPTLPAGRLRHYALAAGDLYVHTLHLELVQGLCSHCSLLTARMHRTCLLWRATTTDKDSPASKISSLPPGPIRGAGCDRPRRTCSPQTFFGPFSNLAGPESEDGGEGPRTFEQYVPYIMWDCHNLRGGRDWQTGTTQ
jgi:hypothetical protein